MRKLLLATLLPLFAAASTFAAEFNYQPMVSLKPGKTTLLKGARGKACGDPAPSWSEVAANLPKSATGSFSDGGVGTVKSRSCGKAVPARGIRFTSKTVGKERLTIFGDAVSITVFN